MEAKVDSMEPQETCGHKKFQDSKLEEKAVSIEETLQHIWKGDLNLQDTISDWFRQFFTSCLFWFRIDFCFRANVTAHYCLLPRHFSYCQQYA